MTGGIGEERLVAQVLAGEEAAFAALLDRHHAAVVWLARCFVDRGEAEVLARKAWLEVLDTLREWTPAHSLRAWILCAVARLGRRGAAQGAAGPVGSACTSRGARGWAEAAMATEAALVRVGEALDALPTLQRVVVTLRDVVRCDAAVACAALGLGDAEQRALLHAGRTRLRDALQAHASAAASM